MDTVRWDRIIHSECAHMPRTTTKESCEWRFSLPLSSCRLHAISLSSAPSTQIHTHAFVGTGVKSPSFLPNSAANKRNKSIFTRLDFLAACRFVQALPTQPVLCVICRGESIYNLTIYAHMGIRRVVGKSSSADSVPSSSATTGGCMGRRDSFRDKCVLVGLVESQPSRPVCCWRRMKKRDSDLVGSSAFTAFPPSESLHPV